MIRHSLFRGKLPLLTFISRSTSSRSIFLKIKVFIWSCHNLNWGLQLQITAASVKLFNFCFGWVVFVNSCKTLGKPQITNHRLLIYKLKLDICGHVILLWFEICKQKNSSTSTNATFDKLFSSFFNFNYLKMNIGQASKAVITVPVNVHRSVVKHRQKSLLKRYFRQYFK